MKMRLKRLIIISCSLLFTVCSAQASDFVGSVNGVLDYYLTGHSAKAAIQLRESMNVLWAELPLAVDNSRIVKDLQSYVSRTDNSFKLGEPMNITWQILGYGVSQQGGGYAINIAMDTQVVAADGAVIKEQKNVHQFSRLDPIRSTEFFAYLTYSIGKGVPGDYILRIHLRDLNSSKKTSFDVPFVLK